MTKAELIKRGKCNGENCNDCVLGQYDGTFMGLKIYSCKEDIEDFEAMPGDAEKAMKLSEELRDREATPEEEKFLRAMIRRSIKKMQRMGLA